MNDNPLAIFGGPSVRQHPWPVWPRADKRTEQYLLDVLYSGRWAISGMYNDKKLYERRFAEAFAAYHNVSFCVPTSNGSSALTIALEALGIGQGDEVLVPGLTWVACPSAVLQTGATPVLVDIDSDTLCMSVEAAHRAISARTKAVMLVHLYCAVADLDAFVNLSEATNIPLLEDCSQAHGATWKGQRVGSFGKIGVFSMQNTKVLTAGEGGAAITNDSDLYHKMQQLRANGRCYTNTPPPVGHIELEEVGSVHGINRCLSEFQAAILLDRLDYLDEENKQREQNAVYLRHLLSEVGDITPLFRHPNVDNLTYYRFCMRLNLDAFGGAKIENIKRALEAELKISINLTDMPLNKNKLYNPLKVPHLKTQNKLDLVNPARFSLPNAMQARESCLALPHKVLLGTKEDMKDIAAAFLKLKEHKALLLDVPIL